ncbi:MBOAT family O-acyltransferase [Spongiivirga citrea]|uniref:MBOAT family protein n=1 Tax=Spongiivirga citrea TaxID=1481457 RepID=A0A6M0CLI9_9FLAO|nr:MBOAT family O-acyltransferase [Spongiivirga citrea]NER16874.1 MBOAT family protein [Spongiivirga citrea]
MLFTSFDFAFFLPIVFLLYWIFYKNIKVQNVIIVLASYVFYGWWDWRFLSLIFISSLVDFLVGRELAKVESKKGRKGLLLISLTVNIGFLAFFKYFNFFLDNFYSIFTFFGQSFNGQLFNIVLPVGISFYTFQTLSYTIDIYRNKLRPTKDPIAFFAFVSFFPQLVAGPIERASNLLPQFASKRFIDDKTFSYGFKLMVWGFFLKLVVADRAAIYVNAVYNNVESHDGLTFIMATVLFAFQIYGDFAGYSLIAIGTAKLFGFDLMTNFKRPYFARSVSEFWGRWHISLSTWFRDYVYIPLGGNRTSKQRWLYNLFITFVISGLWHGANWTFIIWGALNGAYLILEVLFNKKRRSGIHNVLLTFILICFSWVFFRSNTVGDSFLIVKDIFTNPGDLYIGIGDDITAPIYAVLGITLLLLFEVRREYFTNLLSAFWNRYQLVRMTGYSIIIFLILYLGVFNESQFIYFQF